MVSKARPVYMGRMLFAFIVLELLVASALAYNIFTYQTTAPIPIHITQAAVTTSAVDAKTVQPAQTALIGASSTVNTTSCYSIPNITQLDTFSVKSGQEVLLNATENYITPNYSGLTMNGANYTFYPSNSYNIGQFTLKLINISYIPIEQTINLQLCTANTISNMQLILPPAGSGGGGGGGAASYSGYNGGGSGSGGGSTSDSVSSNNSEEIQNVTTPAPLLPPQTALITHINGFAGIIGLNSSGVKLLKNLNVSWIRQGVGAQGWNALYANATKNNINIDGIIGASTINNNKSFTLSNWNYTVKEAVKNYPNVKAWEIWNEPQLTPNQYGYWNGNATHYYKMLKSAYTIIKASNPNAIVVGFGGLSLYGASSSGTSVELLNNVDKLGGASYYDAIAIHAYPWSSSSWSTTTYNKSLSLYSNISKSVNKPLWITEVAVESGKTNQSAYIKTMYPIFKKYNVTNVFWFTLNDWNTTTGYGLVNPNYTPKAGYYAYQTYVTKVSGSGSGGGNSSTYGTSVSNIILGINSNLLYKAPTNISLSNGIQFYRSILGLNSTEENNVKLQQQKYAMQYLGVITSNGLSGNWTLNDWNSVVSKMIKAYPNVTHWEIWNQPLTSGEESGYQNGNALHYYEMVKSAYTLIRKSSPNATVVCFGGAVLGNSTYATWAKQVWSYGAANYCTAISLHAYLGSGKTLNSTVEANWNTSINSYESLTGKSIWITEVGEPLSGNGQLQQSYMQSAFAFFNSYKYVKRAYWYDLYGYSGASYASGSYSLLNVSTLKAEPSWSTFLKLYNKSLSFTNKIK